MSKGKTAVLCSLVLAGLAAGLGGCTQQHPVAFQGGAPVHDVPAQGWWRYQFVYHPSAQVYFEPYTRTYYWFDQGLWEEGLTLPDTFTLDPETARVVRLQSQKPYVHHDSVTSHHGSFYGEIPGSTDPYHATPEAIAQSEYRAAIRLASTLEELYQISDQIDPHVGVTDTVGEVTDVSDQVGSVSEGVSSDM